MFHCFFGGPDRIGNKAEIGQGRQIAIPVWNQPPSQYCRGRQRRYCGLGGFEEGVDTGDGIVAPDDPRTRGGEPDRGSGSGSPD